MYRVSCLDVPRTNFQEANPRFLDRDLSGLRAVLDDLRDSTHDFEAAWAKIEAAAGDEDNRVPAGAVLTEANPCVVITADQVQDMFCIT